MALIPRSGAIQFELSEFHTIEDSEDSSAEHDHSAHEH